MAKQANSQLARQTIRKTVANFSAYNFNGTISDAIEMLENLGKLHGINAQLDYSDHNPYDDTGTMSFNVDVLRLETDREYEDRVACLEQSKQARIVWLESELARLRD